MSKGLKIANKLSALMMQHPRKSKPSEVADKEFEMHDDDESPESEESMVHDGHSPEGDIYKPKEPKVAAKQNQKAVDEPSHSNKPSKGIKDQKSAGKSPQKSQPKMK